MIAQRNRHILLQEHGEASFERRQHRSFFSQGRSPKGWKSAVVFLAASAFATLVSAQSDQCSDINAAGNLECTYRPHVVEDWQYEIPGPYKATDWYFDEQGAKDAYAGILAANCPGCCDPGSLSGQSSWVDRTVMAWSPDITAWSDKTLTYTVVGAPDSHGVCPPSWTFTATLSRHRQAYCELPWASGTLANGNSFCSRPRRNGELCFGNPIALPSASKVFREVDFSSVNPDGLKFIRYYRSDGFSYPSGYAIDLWQGLGETWTSNYTGFISVTTSSVWVSWAAQPPQYFYPPNSSNFPQELKIYRAGQKTRLVQLSQTDYAYYTANNTLILYRQGLISAIYSPTGWGVSLTYVGSQLVKATETSGRQLQFGYDAIGHLQTIMDPNTETITYGYKPAPTSEDMVSMPEAFTTLSKVTYQDSQSRQYQTGNWAVGQAPGNLFATRIVGVTDENGHAYETITYNSQGLASSSYLAGGVDKFVVTGATVTDPLQTQRSYNYDTSAADFRSEYQPAGSGCGASSSSNQYSNGNLSQHQDFDGHLACYAYDTSHNVETARVEGLDTYAACSSVLPSGSVLPAGSRKTSTQWHPDWRFAVKVAEPGTITTNVYNGQPDPFNANAVASCAPSTATLPDGKPIAVLCKKVIQATTDTDGSQGFNAPLDTKVSNRIWTYTYNQYGQVLTAKGPRTDVNDTTTYAYYSDTTSSHTIGDLQSVTDALNHVTSYTQYDPSGNLLEKVDANNVVTDYTYDARQRLKTVKVGSQTTTYDYWPTGLLKQVTFPDQSTVAYSYDDAHRLTDVTDSQGNSVHYVLDNAGNRKAEQYKDPSGALKSELDHIYDALGRVQQTTGRE
jgi:YD repeat-containing protein